MSALSFLPKNLNLVLAICLVYMWVWLSYYGQITLGQYLSHEETLTLQTALSGATIGEHVTLYNKLLAALSFFTDTEGGLLSVIRILNSGALLLTAIICAITAGHFWKSDHAACVAALLVGLNPVIIFLIGQATPTALAALCVAIFFWRIMRWLRHAKPADSFIIGLALAVGTLLETSLAGLTLLWPIVAFLYPKRHKALHLILGVIPTAAAFCLISVFNLQLQQALSFDTSNIAAKLYGFFSNQEVDDGISYAIHSKQHLLLLLNPINWGLLIILAAGGVYARIKDGHRGYSVYTYLLALIIVWVTYALTNGGGQNRLALIPLLAVFAAGSFTVIPRIWKHASKTTYRRIVAGTVSLTLLTYTGYFINSPSVESREVNYTYMANACIELGKNETAVTWAEKALEINSARGDMRNVLVRAEFNAWATISNPKPLTSEAVKAYLEAIDAAAPSDPTIASIKGFYLWKSKHQDRAIAIWKANAANSPLAQIGILWSQDKATLSALNKPGEGTPYYHLLHIANQIDRSALTYGKEERMIDNLFAEAH
ncbi:MAG: hypothetical protein ABF330_00020 [Lentimonas sp.]